MAENIRTVSHEGIVLHVQGHQVQVKIVNRSACAACHAKSLCPAADTKDKIVDAVAGGHLQPGDRVRVIMAEKIGWAAVLWAFLLPFLLLTAVLLGIYLTTGNQISAALWALASMLPYYSGLYFFRDRVFHDFVFSAEPVNGCSTENGH